MVFSVWEYKKKVSADHNALGKERCQAFYEDLREESQLALFTNTFQNIHVVVLVLLLVTLESHPLAQSVAYVASAVLGLAWDLVVRPYDGRLMICQMIWLDVTRLAAGVGYLILTIPGTSLDTATILCRYEIIVFFAAVTIGMILAIVQQILGAMAQLKECFHKYEDDHHMVKVSSSSSLHPASSFGFSIRTLGMSSFSPANLRLGDSAGGLEDSSATGSQKFDRSIVS